MEHRRVYFCIRRSYDAHRVVLGVPEMTSQYLDGEYLRKNQTWHVEDSEWKSRQIVKMLVKFMKTVTYVNGHLMIKYPIRRICEVGCGAGDILVHLQTSAIMSGVDFTGYDISPQAISLCANKENDHLRFFCHDFTKDDDRYDVILVMDVIEHLEDPYDFLRAIKPKGCLKIFHLHLDVSVQAALRVNPIMKSRRDLGHLQLYCKETAVELLKECDYEILDVTLPGGLLELPSKSLKQTLARPFIHLLRAISTDWAARVFGGSVLILAR